MILLKCSDCLWQEELDSFVREMRESRLAAVFIAR